MSKPAGRSKNLFVLKSPNAPWGDYGATLFEGSAAYRSREGRLLLKRTGPFVPPLTMPGIGCIVVTDGLKRQLRESRLTGLSFREVRKKLIVKLNWELWDLGARNPTRYPAGGEPENYIMGRRHSARSSRTMGRLWEVRLGVHARHLELGRRAKSTLGVGLHYSTWDGTDFFYADLSSYIFVSQRAKEWLQSKIDPWVRFERAVTR